MQSRDFCYWLQGYFEISGSTELTPEQTEMIRNHLKMVWIHELDPIAPPLDQVAPPLAGYYPMFTGWDGGAVAKC